MVCHWYGALSDKEIAQSQAGQVRLLFSYFCYLLMSFGYMQKIFDADISSFGEPADMVLLKGLVGGIDNGNRGASNEGECSQVLWPIFAYLIFWIIYDIYPKFNVFKKYSLCDNMVQTLSINAENKSGSRKISENLNTYVRVDIIFARSLYLRLNFKYWFNLKSRLPEIEGYWIYNFNS